MNSNTLKAAGALTVNAAVFGLSWWPFRQLQLAGLHPLWATVLTYGLALLVISLWQPRAWVQFGRFPILWVLVASSGLTNLGFNWAVTTGDVVRVVLLFYLMPVWSAGLAWWLLGEKPSLALAARVALALLGVALVLQTPQSYWPVPHDLPDALALGSGFFFALTNVMLRRLDYVPGTSRVVAMFAGGVLMSAAVGAWGVAQGWAAAPAMAAAGWPVALVLSLAFVASNFGLQYGAARLSAHATALIMPSEIIFAAVSSFLMGAADFSLRTVLGGALILAAAVLSAWTHQSEHT